MATLGSTAGGRSRRAIAAAPRGGSANGFAAGRDGGAAGGEGRREGGAIAAGPGSTAFRSISALGSVPNGLGFGIRPGIVSASFGYTGSNDAPEAPTTPDANPPRAAAPVLRPREAAD